MDATFGKGYMRHTHIDTWRLVEDRFCALSSQG